MRFREMIWTLPLLTIASCTNSDTDNFVAPIIAETTVSAISSTYQLSDSQYDVPWMPGDDISIFKEDSGGEAMKYTSMLQSNQSATSSLFTGNLFENEGGVYYAIYPHYSTNSADYTAETISFELAETQSYDSTKQLFATGLNVAVAQSDLLGEFEFSNVCGFLQIRLIGSGNIDKISVTTSEGVNLWGRATVDMSTKEVTIVNEDPDAATVTLECGGVEISDAERLFTIVLPPIESTNEIQVTVNEVTELTTTSSSVISGVDGATIEQSELTYLMNDSEITVYTIDEVNATNSELLASNAWILVSDSVITAAAMNEVIDLAAAQSDDKTVSFLFVTEIPEGSVASPLSVASNKLTLSFPSATKINPYAFSRWTGQVEQISIIAAESIEVDENAFVGFDTESCSLLVDVDYNPFIHNMTTCTTWRGLKWGAINGVREYDLEEFNTSTGELTNGDSIVGSTWWINLEDAGDSSTFAGVKAAVDARSEISIRLFGSVNTNANYTYALSASTAIDSIDMSNLSAIPDYFLNSSSVTYVKFSKDLLSIGSNVFNACRSLETVAFTEGEREVDQVGYEVGNQAFKQCSALTELTLEWAYKLGESAFTETAANSGSTGMQILKLPRAKQFGTSVFGSANALNELYLTCNSDFYNNAGTTEIVSGSTYVNILGSVFARCMSSIHLYLHSSKKDATVYSTQQNTQKAYFYSASNSSTAGYWVWHVNSNSSNTPLQWYRISFVSDNGDVDGYYSTTLSKSN